MKEILQKLVQLNEKQNKELQGQTKATLDLKKEFRSKGMSDADITKELKKIAAGGFKDTLTKQNKAILDEQRERKVHNTIAGNIGGAVKRGVGGAVSGVANFLTPRGFLDKTGIVKQGGGGIIDQAFEARKARNDRIKARVMAGEVPEVKGVFNKLKQGFQLSGEAKKEQKQRREQAKLETAVEKDKQFMINNGIDEKTAEEAAMKKDGRGQKLNALAKLTSLSSFGSKDDKKDSKNSSKKDGEGKKDSKGLSEKEREDIKARDDQTKLLEKIVENTGGSTTTGGGSEDTPKGGGLLKGIGAGLGFLGKGIAGLGKGLGILAKSIGQGLAQGILAMVPALAALAAPPVLLGLGALTLAFMGIGKALGYMAPFMEKLAPVLSDVVKTMGSVLIEFIKGIPEMIVRIGGVITDLITTIAGAITGFMDKIVESIERLSVLDAGNMLKVGLGLTAIAGGLIAFSAGEAVAGVTNLVGGLFRAVTGQKSTVENLQEIAALGPDLEKAGVGMEKLARGMGGFDDVDSEQVEEQVVAASDIAKSADPAGAVAATRKSNKSQRRQMIDERRMKLRQQVEDLPPGEYIIKQGVVYDAKSGDIVSDTSKQISDYDREARKGGGNANINAPTNTNINTQTSNNFIRPQVRNNDNTVSAYYRGNWALESNASSF